MPAMHGPGLMKPNCGTGKKKPHLDKRSLLTNKTAKALAPFVPLRTSSYKVYRKYRARLLFKAVYF